MTCKNIPHKNSFTIESFVKKYCDLQENSYPVLSKLEVNELSIPRSININKYKSITKGVNKFALNNIFFLCIKENTS